MKNEDNVKKIEVNNKKQEIFVGVDDEAVMNCEGGPCNFVIKDLDTD